MKLIYKNCFGNPIYCAICNKRGVLNSFSASLQFGGNREVNYCHKHKDEARQMAKDISTAVSILNINQSQS